MSFFSRKIECFTALYLLSTQCLPAQELCCRDECFHPQESCWGTFDIRGDFLYWQPIVTGMAYALTHTNVAVPYGPFGPTIAPDNLSIKNVNFDYGPGYRIGARYTLPENEWDFDASYTRISQTGRDSVQAGNGILIDTLWDALSAVNSTEARADFKIALQEIKLTVGKTIPFCGCLILRPNFGVQYFSLDADEDIEYSGTTIVGVDPQASSANVQLKNDTEGWGLLVGLDAFWTLPCHFQLFGKANYGIVRTEFVSSQNQQTEVATQSPIDLTSTSKFNAMRQNVQIFGGISWSYPFSYRCHPLIVDLHIGYEMSLWVQNVQLSRVLSLGTGFSDAITTNIGNVAFRGLTAGAGLRF